MSIIPKKKFGIAMPIIAKVVVILSIYLPLNSADIIQITIIEETY